MFIKEKVNQIDCSFLINKRNNNIVKRWYRSHAFFFCLQNKFFESSQGDPVNFLPHGNHEQLS